MKKTETKTKKEKITLASLASLIEKLAVFTVNSFTEMKQEFQEVKQEIVLLKEGQEGIKTEISSIKEDQKEIKRAVQSLERKQSGTLISLDETVHRGEFNKLARRVELLES